MYDFDGLQPLVSQHLKNFRVRQHLDIVGAFDTVCQITGHILTQVAAAEKQEHARSLIRKKHDGLPGRVAPADHDDLRPSAQRASIEVAA
jgi:hypothetical protein